MIQFCVPIAPFAAFAASTKEALGDRYLLKSKLALGEFYSELRLSNGSFFLKAIVVLPNISLEGSDSRLSLSLFVRQLALTALLFFKAKDVAND